MEEVRQLFRPCILASETYCPARIDGNVDGILLDCNESNFGSVLPDDDTLHRYPSPLHRDLKAKIAKFRNVQPEQIFVGVGADESIDTVVRAFCTPGKDAIVVTQPTFSVYEQRACVCDVSVVHVPLKSDFQLDMETMLKEACRPDVKIIFLCSPGNPTAVSLNIDDVISLLDSAYKGIVFLDELYIDFSGKESLARLVDKYPRLIVLQSLSKSFGLAGIRFGWSIAHEEIVIQCDKIRLPYNIGALSYSAALKALDHVDDMKTMTQQVLLERDRLVDALRRIKEVKKVFPSEANFLMIQVDNALKVQEIMRQKGVYVSYKGNCLHFDDCLRISICTAKERETVLTVIRESCIEAKV